MKMIKFDFEDRICAGDAIFTDFILPVREIRYNEMVAPCYIILPCVDGTKEALCRLVMPSFIRRFCEEI